MPKKPAGVKVYVVFFSGFYYDGGDVLISIHRTRAGAKARVKEQTDKTDYRIEKFELED